ncbi:MAG: trypsin-like peptidase domain-containing protein [bacterium]|nr:trypsin-like peptidase domain-containing protein [bacterium]
MKSLLFMTSLVLLFGIGNLMSSKYSTIEIPIFKLEINLKPKIDPELEKEIREVISKSEKTQKRKIFSANQLFNQARLYTVSLHAFYKKTDLGPDEDPSLLSKKEGGYRCYGIVISTHYILTDGHCVEDLAKKQEVEIWAHFSKTHNRVLRKAVEVVGYTSFKSTTMDIALLKFKDVNFAAKVFAPLGKSDKTKTGEDIIVIGGPYSINEFLTSGKIGKKTAPPYYLGPELLATEAKIFPGNSGGPILNLKGEVLGLCDFGWPYHPIINIEQIHFFTGIDDVKIILPRLLKGGEIELSDFPYGIKDSESLSMPHLKEMGLDSINAEGPVVLQKKSAIPMISSLNEIFEWLITGDIIKRYDGKIVKTVSDIAKINLLYEPGKEVEVQILRKGKFLLKKIKLINVKTTLKSSDD